MSENLSGSLPEKPSGNTEDISPRYAELDTWDTPTVLSALWEAQMAAVAAVQPALPLIAQAADAAAQALRKGGRLVYAGAGTSGRIGVQDGAELPPTFDWPTDRLVLLIAGGEAALTQAIENAEDQAQDGRHAIQKHGIAPHDVVIGLAASGNTPFTVACLEQARANGALTIGISNNPGSRLVDSAQYGITIPTGPEAIAGSTRLKAGTAQKVVLNMLSTAIMVRLNRVHRGLMVDMQARNEKLRRRGNTMLRYLTGCTQDIAAAALDTAQGKVKLAALIVDGCGRREAETRLELHDGNLRAALQDK